MSVQHGVKEVNLSMLDVHDPADISVTVAPDGKTLWVVIEGVCRLRATGGRRLPLQLVDQRPSLQAANTAQKK
jgi:hypothetical protein